MGESLTNLGVLEIKKSKIPKFDEKPPRCCEKSQALKTLFPQNTYIIPIGLQQSY